MRPAPLLLLVVVGFGLACGGGPSGSVPKPWSKREGSKEIVGDSTGEPDREQRAADRKGSQDPRSERAPEGGLLQPNVTVVEPNLPDYLPPVADRYDELAATGKIAECPPGTSLHEDRNGQHCAFPDGLRHGPYLAMHNNGRVREVGPYYGGKRQGWWSTWESDGTLVGSWRWEKGEAVEGEVAP
jgi:hypothetical protein